jgi:hypothetical protein
VVEAQAACQNMVDRAAGSGEQRFSNILKAGRPGPAHDARTSSFEGTILTHALAVELVQAIISRTTKVDFAALGLLNAEIFNVRMRLLLKSIAMALAQMNAIQRLRRIRMTRCLPREVMITLFASNFMPADTRNIFPGGGPSSYTHPDLPSDLKLDWPCPEFVMDILPNWRFSSHNVHGWDALVCLVHAMDDKELQLLAYAYYSTRKPYVWAGHIAKVLQHNAFGANLPEPYLIMQQPLEVALYYTLPLDDNLLHNDTHALSAATVVDSKMLKFDVEYLQKYPAVLQDLTITTKIVFETITERRQSGHVLDAEDLLKVMDHVIRDIDMMWAAKYIGVAAIASNEVKLRFWPMSLAFLKLTNIGGDRYLMEDTGWDELQMKVEQIPHGPRKNIAKIMLAFAQVYSLSEWKRRLSSPERASMFPDRLLKILALQISTP